MENRKDIDGFAADLLDALPMMVVIAREDDGSIVFANDLAARRFGVAPDKAVGHRTADFFVRPEDGHAAATTLERDGSLDGYEAEVRTIAGQKLVVRGCAGRLERNGENLIVTGFDDVTLRRNVERRLRLAQKLDVQRRVTARMAHQLNNALVPIVTYAELLEDLLGPGSPAADHLKRIVSAADRCSLLVEDFRALQGGRSVRPGPVRVGEVLRRCVAALAAVLPQQIGLSLEPVAPEMVIQGDAAALEEAIVGLVLAAADQIGNRRGRIRLSAACSATDAGFGECVIEIAHSGSPLTPFGPDELDMAHADRGGSGSGVAAGVAQDVARSMMGEMSILHEATGSTIRLAFPDAGGAPAGYGTGPEEDN